MKTSDLIGPTLAWAVAECEGFKYVHVFHGDIVQIMVSNKKNESHYFNPTENWAQGGPIIEREFIRLDSAVKGNWRASIWSPYTDAYSQTPLIAAMRCYVASKLGDEVEVPKELK
jgi:hypothetical protein